MKKVSYILIILFCLSLIVSCRNANAVFTTEEDIPEKLVVFAAADLTMTNYGEEFFSSRYNIGEFSGLSEKWGPEAYVFYDVINNFQKDTGIEVEMYYFLQTADLLKALEQCINTSKCPDIIIGSYAAQDYCLYSYFEEEYFADLTPFFEEDEIYTSGEYISNVVKAGKIGNKQYLFPLTFNMNILFSSEESMQRHDLRISEEMGYCDVISLFTESWQQANREESELLMMQFSSYQNEYPYGLFQASSGEDIIDYETGKIVLNKEYFYELAHLYESYIQNDYNLTKEELKKFASLQKEKPSYDKSKYNQIVTAVKSDESPTDIFDVIYNQVGCFSEGGNKSSLMHSFVAQTYYYESRYEDVRENFFCYGIPSRNSSDEYSALVTSYGCVMASSPYIKHAYEFIKVLADSQPFMFLDMSVNKKNSVDRINEFTSIYYELYPNLGTFPPEDEPEGVNWLDESYQITPLSDNTKEYLNYMIDNISGAKLPEGILNEVLTIEIENYIFGYTETLDQAYDNVSQQLKQLEFIN